MYLLGFFPLLVLTARPVDEAGSPGTTEGSDGGSGVPREESAGEESLEEDASDEESASDDEVSETDGGEKPRGTEGVEASLGLRPRLSLNIENSASLKLAGLSDDQLYSWSLGSPLAYAPTLSWTEDLEGLSTIGTGPLNFSDRDFSSPWFW